MRTITIRGEATLRVQPNVTVMNFDLTTRDKEYDKTMQLAAVQLDCLRKALVQVGFKEDALKTSNFNINTEYQNEFLPSGEAKRNFIGFVSNHRLVLEFPFDMKLLSKVIDAVTTSGASPEFTISFSYSNKEQISNQLLVAATTNATSQAITLTSAMGVTLGDIQSILHDAGGVSLFSPTLLRMEAKALDIQPEAIEVHDQVVVVWEIH